MAWRDQRVGDIDSGGQFIIAEDGVKKGNVATLNVVGAATVSVDTPTSVATLNITAAPTSQGLVGDAHAITHGNPHLTNIDDIPTLRDTLDSMAAGVTDPWRDPVIDFLATPPGSPADGDRYIVVATGTGDWAGKETQIATWDDANSVWTFLVPNIGWSLINLDDSFVYIYTASGWTATSQQVNADSVLDTVSKVMMTSGERTKLTSVAADAQPNPPDASSAEIASGTLNAQRTFTPLQIKTMAQTFGTGTPSVQITDPEVTAGTDTAAHTVSAAQLKLAAETHGVGVTNLSNTPGSTTIVLNSSTGTGTTLPAATTGAAGLLIATDKAKLDNVPTNTTTALSGKVDTTLTISTTAPLSGGGALSANRTLAISAATTSAPGSMSAADKTKLNNIQPYDKWQTLAVLGMGTAAGGTAANTYYYMANSASAGRWTGSLYGVSQIKLAVFASATAASTFKALVQFSLDGGSTWILPDGTASNVTNADTLGPVTVSSSTSANEGTYTLHSSISGADQVIAQFFHYDTAGGTGRLPTRADLLAKYAQVLGGAASGLTADQIAPSSDNTQTTLTSDERADIARLKAGFGVLQMFVRFRNVYDVSQDFGTNNLSLNSSPRGDGNDDRAAWNAIIQAASTASPSGYDLIIPWGRYSRVNLPITMPTVKNVNLIYNGTPGGGGIVNGNTQTFWGDNARWAGCVMCCSSISGRTWNDRNQHRLASTSTIRAGTTQITLPVSGDYSALVDGDQIMLLAPGVFIDDNNHQKNPRRFWTTTIRKLSGTVIAFDDPPPFDIPGDLRSDQGGVYPFKRTDNSTINGISMVIAREMDAIGFLAAYTPNGKEFQADRLGVYGLYLGSISGTPFAGFPKDSVFQDVIIDARGHGIYGNGALRNRWTRVHTKFAGCAAELSIFCYANLFDQCTFWYDGVSSYVGSQKYLFGIKEYGLGNEFRDTVCELAGFNKTTFTNTSGAIAPITDMRVFHMDSTNNYIHNFKMNCAQGSTGGLALVEFAPYASPQTDVEYAGSYNTLRNITINSTAVVSGGLSPIIFASSKGNKIQGVKMSFGAGSTSPATVTNNGNFNELRDVDFDGGFSTARNYQINNGCTYNTFERVNGGTFTNNGGSTNLLSNNGTNKARQTIWPT